MKHSALIILLSLIITGCVVPGQKYQTVVDGYALAAPKISLDMTKAQVVEILQPTQAGLPNTSARQPDMYKRDDVMVDILYFRSGWTSDGVSSDDEYTPYLFNDGKLAAVGWQYLGGMKNTAQAVPPAPSVSVYSTNIVY